MKKQKVKAAKAGFALASELIQNTSEVENKLGLSTTDTAGISSTALIVGVSKIDVSQSDAFVEVMRIATKELTEYKRSTQRDVVAGFKINVNQSPIHTIFILADGSVVQENLFQLLLRTTGELRQADAFLRSQVNNSLRGMHAFKNVIVAYQHFFGNLNDEHKDWLRGNTLTYDEQVAATKEVANIKQGNKDDNSSK